MITGAHSIICSVDPEADRAFFRDVLKLPNDYVGHGWLIFGLPPVEVAFHPASTNGKHEFYFAVPDIDAFIASMQDEGVPCTAIHEEPWGRVVDITLPGVGAVGVYQPHYARPPMRTG